MERSALGVGGVLVTAELELFSALGSVDEVTVATFVNKVPSGVPGGMWNTIVKLAVLPAVMLGTVHVTLPLVAPAPGSEQLQPVGGVTETKLHPLVTMSFSVTAAESSGPRFVTAMLNGTSVSALAVAGPLFNTAMSLLCAWTTGAIASAHTNTT